ncbi:MAG: phytanoyl-CoA dioxygenase family protein [Nostoc sp. EfeVER01]|uniref:phytanoyl-CoA dioxygenase family protein n=1 Tax=unclassified Nostoc TaxID=2593658 RepID=UPI002AD2FA14|nr:MULTISPECIES: phytanoyl-CoA dioxygenase family protein [unclassified Nostoc]MDZ7947031.1 phytanoyl-CoA dioxygenase family protein [Nostoc sp. EfeVER01]MDZ7991455.1 phytanoyl-CoA dioxygenase family protein [Nostoc sp. EspVER01]
MEKNISITLMSNGFPLSMDTNRLGWLNSSDITSSIATLKQQYQEQGYLWLKGLLDTKKVMEFRYLFLTKCKRLGLLKEGSLTEDGIFCVRKIKPGIMNKIRCEMITSKEYEFLFNSKEILNFFQFFLNGSVCSLERKIIRCKIPGDYSSDTGSHYDLTYLRCGTNDVYTCWIPLGDIPVEMGGLIYLENSWKLGQQIEQKFDSDISNLSCQEAHAIRSQGMGRRGWITKDLAALSDLLNSRWLVAEYKAGDVVVHSPYIIHASSTNQDLQKRIRLSTDIRYQRVDYKIDQRWRKAWQPDDNL